MRSGGATRNVATWRMMICGVNLMTLGFLAVVFFCFVFLFFFLFLFLFLFLFFLFLFFFFFLFFCFFVFSVFWD